jgi:hypothetical protein
METGYILFADAEAPFHLRHWHLDSICPACGFARSEDGDELKASIPKRFSARPVFGTLDNMVLWRQDAIDLIRSSTTNFSVRPVPGSTFFVLEPANIIPFDLEAGEMRLLKRCDRCGRFDEVIFNGHPHVKVQVAESEIYRTDWPVGSGSEKRPVLVVGHRLKAILIAAKIGPLIFKKCFLSR